MNEFPRTGTDGRGLDILVVEDSLGLAPVSSGNLLMRGNRKCISLTQPKGKSSPSTRIRRPSRCPASFGAQGGAPARA